MNQYQQAKRQHVNTPNKQQGLSRTTVVRRTINDFITNKISFAQFQARLTALGIDQPTIHRTLEAIMNGQLTVKDTLPARDKPAVNDTNQDDPMWKKHGWIKKQLSQHEEVYVGEFRTRFGTFPGEVVAEKPINRMGQPNFKVYIKDPPKELKNHPMKMCFFDKGRGLHYINLTTKPSSVDNAIGNTITELDRCFTTYK